MKDTDYRVVHWHTAGADTYAIHQVFYDHKGNPQRISPESIIMEASDITILKDQHFHIAAAFLQEILPGHLYKSGLTNSSTNVLNKFFPKK